MVNGVDRTHYRQTKPSLFPIAVIPKSLQRYLFTKVEGKEKILEVDRYEFLIYRLLRNALESAMYLSSIAPSFAVSRTT